MTSKFRSGVVVAFLLAAPRALAQEPPSGFAIDRFEPADRGSSWFALDSLDLRGHRRHAVGDVTELGYKPLVLYNADGSERAALLRAQLFTHLGGTLLLWDRARFGFNLPILVYQSAESGTLASSVYSAATGATIGDLRFGGDARLYGKYGDPITVAAGLQLWMPTGDRASYTGDGKVRLQPRVQAAGESGDFAYAARLGVAVRTQDEPFAGTPMGSELTFGVAGGVRAVHKHFLFGPELYGSTGISSSEAFFGRRTTPVELLLGAHYRVTDDLHLDFGIGPGLTRGVGTPLFRTAFSVAWAPAYRAPPLPLPPDRDRDMVYDMEDACPDVPGVRTGDPRTNGCPPPPPDRDGDGVFDPEDACPDVPGVRTDDPRTNGCPPPPPDRDGDTVIDSEDACPDVPGVRTEDPKTNGCPPPPPDRDNDTIIDPEDACPDVPGPRDADPKKNGCPPARIEAGQIKITEQVKFAFFSAKILPESDAILKAVLEVLVAHPEITKLSVEGHTDNQGAAALNKELSRQRAAAVVAWLVKHGVAKGRLVSTGFGKDRPIDTNDTEQGRANNRRVELHIKEPKGQPPAAPPAPRAPSPGGAPPPPATAPAAVAVPPAPGSAAAPPAAMPVPPASGSAAPPPAPPPAPAGAPPGKK
jgi:outer membrane protein OmpA-like peptidoglycan-associated protein